MRIRAFLFIALALVLAQTSFGGTVFGSGGTISNCYSLPPSGIYTQFNCSLYNDVSSYSFDLSTLVGPDITDNGVGTAYVIVINGVPTTLPDDNTGLFNQGLWQTVLYSPGDGCSGFCSDQLTVDWPGAFPTVLTVRAVDGAIEAYYNTLYGPGSVSDSDFFVESTGLETVYLDNTHNYYIYNTPEPGTIVLLGSSLALLSGVFLRRRRAAGRAA